MYSVGGSRTEEKILHSHLDKRLEGEFFGTSFETAKAVLDRIAAGEITARRGGKISKAQQKAVAKYEAKVYDKTLIRLPKGHLDALKAHAAARKESVNGFIGRAIAEAMERDNGGRANSPADAAQNAVESVSGVGATPTPLPAQNKDHPFSGNWKGHQECHILPDWLLIYWVSETNLYLARTGAHSDLFRE